MKDFYRQKGTKTSYTRQKRELVMVRSLFFRGCWGLLSADCLTSTAWAIHDGLSGLGFHFWES